MRVTTYYCTYNNFGDNLNIDIFKKYGLKVISSRFEESSIIGIGTLLNKTLFTNKSNCKNTGPVYCFGAGLYSETQLDEIQKDLEHIFLKKNIYFSCVRGEKTKEQLIKYGLISNSDDIVLADGGLLACDISEKSSPKYDVGFVLNNVDKNEEKYINIFNSIPNSIIIDIAQSPKLFLKELTSCKVIVSTALHPLIAADSFNIPNIWLESANMDILKKFKFEDYYSIYGITVTPISIDCVDKDIQHFVNSNYNIPFEIVLEKQEKLRLILFKIQKELKSQRKYVYTNLLRHILYLIICHVPYYYFYMPIKNVCFKHLNRNVWNQIKMLLHHK